MHFQSPQVSVFYPQITQITQIFKIGRCHEANNKAASP